MAEFLIRSSLNPNKVVKLGITFRQVVPKNNDGDHIWIVELNTNEPDKDGNGMVPSYIRLTDLSNLDKEIKKAASVIAKKIDWSPVLEDSRPPYIISVTPSEYLVDIDSFISVSIKESLPSAGIDLSSIKMTINDIDVTSDLIITGDPYEYNVKWIPPYIVRESI